MSCNRRCWSYLHSFVECLATDADHVSSLASSLLARHVTVSPHLIWSHHHGLFVCLFVCLVVCLFVCLFLCVPFLFVSCVTCQHAVPFLLGATCRLRNENDVELQGGLPQGATTVIRCPRTMMDGDTCQITCPPTRTADGPLVCTNGQLAIPACLPSVRATQKTVIGAIHAINKWKQSSTKTVASNMGGISDVTSHSSGLVGVGGVGGVGIGGSSSVVSAGTLRSRATSRSLSPSRSRSPSPSPASSSSSSSSSRQVRSTSRKERKRTVSPTLSPVASVRSLTTATVGNKKV